MIIMHQDVSIPHIVDSPHPHKITERPEKKMRNEISLKKTPLHNVFNPLHSYVKQHWDY